MTYSREFGDGDYDGGVGQIIWAIGGVDCTWSLQFGGSVWTWFRNVDLALDGEMGVLIYEERWDGGVEG